MGEPRLAAAPRAGEGHQSLRFDQLADVGQLLFAAEEAIGRRGVPSGRHEGFAHPDPIMCVPAQ